MGAAVCAAAVLMARHAGLIDGLDFGAGQYYYTDIPGWRERFAPPGLRERGSTALFVTLLVAWGALMYWLWRRVDR